MNTKFLTFSILLFASHGAKCQDILDLEKYKGAELFAVKNGYDPKQRIQQIDSLAGKEVTVYQVAGKQNRIKLTYTGVVTLAPSSKLSDKTRAAVVPVVVRQANGTKSAYFPLTNDNRYRIYLTAKLK